MIKLILMDQSCLLIFFMASIIYDLTKKAI